MRRAAHEMARAMSDISDDENSPTYDLSLVEMHVVLDDAERAVTVGAQIASAIASSSTGSAPTRSHVDRVADQMISMLEGADENMEEEDGSDSDEEMETRSERARRYLSSEMCEVSDPEEWMVYHHGMSEDEPEPPVS